MKLILKMCLFFGTFCTAQSSPSIECSYYAWQLGNSTIYECALAISNPNGFDNFTRILGDHVPGFNDLNVTEVPFANGLSTNIPQIICRQFPKITTYRSRQKLPRSLMLDLSINKYYNPHCLVLD